MNTVSTACMFLFIVVPVLLYASYRAQDGEAEAFAVAAAVVSVLIVGLLLGSWAMKAQMRCPEDAVLVGVGSYDGRTEIWDDYACVPRDEVPTWTQPQVGSGEETV